MATAKKTTAPWDAGLKKEPAAKKAVALRKVPAKKAAPAPTPEPAAKNATLRLKVVDMTVPKEKKHIKFPKTLPELADRYYAVMQERLALAKNVAKLEEEEKALKLHIINNLPLSAATGVAGRSARVQVVQKTRNQVVDWDKIYGYIHKNWKKGSYALLQKRLNDAAVNEILDSGTKLEGVTVETYKSLSCNKVA